MMILYEFGSFRPLLRVHGWALERLISVGCISGDARWLVVALALRSFTAIWAIGQRRFALPASDPASRAGQDADSMVAAGGG
jgi:hypothetical protein